MYTLYYYLYDKEALGILDILLGTEFRPLELQVYSYSCMCDTTTMTSGK